MDGQAVAAGQRAPVPSVSMMDNRWVKWCVYALMAFPIVDFGLRLHQVHPLGVIWDKVDFITLAIVAVARYLSGFRPKWFSWHKMAGWYILFALAVMFAGMATPIMSVQGFRIDIYYILFAFLLPFVIGPKDVLPLLHIGASVAILIAVHGVYQYITKAPIPTGWADVTETVRTRVYSVLQSPNELGSYMAMMTPLLAGLTWYERHRWRKLLYGFGTVMCAAALLLTFTRGALLALALAMVITAIVFERRLLILLLVLFVVAFFLPPIQHRITDLFSPVYWIQAVKAGRVMRWLIAFDKMATNPLLGIGLGQYGGAVASHYGLSIYSDNYYAKTMGESGLIGLVLFMAMHVSLMWNLVRHSVRRISGRAKFVAIGGLTGLLAVLIHNGMENVFEFAPMAAMYFVYATLLLIWGTGADEEVAREDR